MSKVLVHGLNSGTAVLDVSNVYQSETRLLAYKKALAAAMALPLLCSLLASAPQL